MLLFDDWNDSAFRTWAPFTPPVLLKKAAFTPEIGLREEQISWSAAGSVIKVAPYVCRV